MALVFFVSCLIALRDESIAAKKYSKYFDMKNSYISVNRRPTSQTLSNCGLG
jgi:hypothetical protein